MTKQLPIVTHAVVEEDNELVCGATCPHKEFLFQHRCRIFGEMLKRAPVGRHFGFLRCQRCVIVAGGPNGKAHKADAGESTLRARSPQKKKRGE